LRTEQPYNPLDKRNLGVSVADALLAKVVEPLPPTEAFIGAGIYAIYYVGNYPAYEPLARQNRGDQFKAPIYVGKAIPRGGRKGGFDLGVSPGTVLYERLQEHKESIEQALNLDLKDFFCRYLVVDDIWIPLGESLLISMFSPLWNVVIDGFGIHNPGGNRKQRRSRWDVLHPGRPWVGNLLEHSKTEAELLELVRRALGP
jgi:hypothetical protein